MNLIRHQPLRVQIGLLVGCALLFLLSIAGLGMGLQQQVQARSDALRLQTQRLAQARDLVDAVNRRAILLRNLVLNTDSARHAAMAETVRQSHAQTQSVMQALAQRLDEEPDAELRALAQALLDSEAVYAPIAVRITQVAAAGDKVAAQRQIELDCQPQLEALLRAGQAYVTAALRQQTEALASLHGLLSVAQRAQLGAVAVAVLLLGGLGWALGRDLVRLSREAVDAVQAMRDGDFRHAPQAHGRNELARIVQAVAQMHQVLRETMQTLAQTAQDIAQTSHTLATGGQDLAQRTERSAASLEETAASLEQLTATVQHTSAASQKADRLASEAAQSARVGGGVVRELVQTMQSIQQSSARVGDISGVIDGIAFQTNILALNAAVEAARAGEAGRGFAVVAAEVRGLAQRSAQAAREIKALIEEAVQRANDGAGLAQQAGQSIDTVVHSAEQVSQLVTQINHSTGEQASGIAQVNTAVGDLDRITQHNAALVQQTSSAADSLADKVAQLHRAIGYFRFA